MCRRGFGIMNQLLNLIAYGLLTKEQQVGFCPEAKLRGMYEIFCGKQGWLPCSSANWFSMENAYRLKILPEEWYFAKVTGCVEPFIKLGKDSLWNSTEINILRPALPAEIPKPVRPPLGPVPLFIRIEKEWPGKEVVMLKPAESAIDIHDDFIVFVYEGGWYAHHCAQSLKGFFKYVYVCNNGELQLGHTPTAEFASYETVAFLLNKEPF
jgi:hypothetical protein